MANVDSLLEQEREKLRSLEKEFSDMKTQLEGQVLTLDGKWKTEQMKAVTLQGQLE